MDGTGPHDDGLNFGAPPPDRPRSWTPDTNPPDVISGPRPGTSPAAAAPVPAPAPGGRRRAVLTAAVLGAVLAGGASYAAAALSGGGSQPEAHVPADAIAFVKVDFDPSAGQKIAALRFAKAFPDTDVDENGDLKSQVLRQVFDGSDRVEGLDYDRDVAPWLGDRFAVAVLPARYGATDTTSGGPNPDRPPGSRPRTLVVVQVTDEAKARTGIDKVLAAQRDDFADDPAAGRAADPLFGGYVIRDGYALLAATDAEAVTMADAAQDGSLSKDKEYADDVASLDGDQVALGWVDVAATARTAVDLYGADLPLLPNALVSGANAGDGPTRTFAGLRFDAKHVEVQGRTVGGNPAGAGRTPGKDLAGALPDTTVAALSLTGLGAAVEQAYRALDKPGTDGLIDPEEIARETGLDLPADIVTLLGTQDLLAFGGTDPDGNDQGDVLKIALRTVNDDKDAARAVGRKAAALGSDSGQDTFVAPTEDGWVYASTDEYAKTVARADGTLGETDTFRRAVPDADGAAGLLYVDVALFARAIGETEEPDLAPLGAFGVTTRQDGSHGIFRARLTLR